MSMDHVRVKPNPQATVEALRPVQHKSQPERVQLFKVPDRLQWICSYLFSDPGKIDQWYDRRTGVAFALTCTEALGLWRESFVEVQRIALPKKEVQKKSQMILRSQELLPLLRGEVKGDQGASVLAAHLQKEYPRASDWTLRDMALSNEDWTKLFEILAHCKQVKGLDFIECEVDIEGGVDIGLCPDLFAAIGKCQQLEYFRYEGGALADNSLALLAGCGELSDLRLVRTQGLSKEGIAYLKEFPKLSRVMWQYTPCDDPIILELLGEIPGLTEFRFYSREDNRAIKTGIPLFLNKAKSLRSLMIDIPGLPDQALEGLPQHTQLQQFHLYDDEDQGPRKADKLCSLLENCTELRAVTTRGIVSAERVRQLAQKLPHLSSLCLDNMTDEIAEMVSLCPQLKSLRVNEDCSLTDKGMQAIAARCGKLMELRFGSTFPVVAKTLLPLRQLPHLRRLQFVTYPSADFSEKSLHVLNLSNKSLSTRVFTDNADQSEWETIRYDHATLFRFLDLQLPWLGQMFSTDHKRFEQELELLKQAVPKYYELFDASCPMTQAGGRLYVRAALGTLKGHLELEKTYAVFQRLADQAEIGIDPSKWRKVIKNDVKERYDKACKLLGYGSNIPLIDKIPFAQRIQILRLAQATLLLEMMKLNIASNYDKGFREHFNLLRDVYPEMSKELAFTPQMKPEEIETMIDKFCANLHLFVTKSLAAPKATEATDRKDGT